MVFPDPKPISFFLPQKVKVKTDAGEEESAGNFSDKIKNLSVFPNPPPPGLSVSQSVRRDLVALNGLTGGL